MLVIKMMNNSGQYCTSLSELMILHSGSFTAVAVVTGFLAEHSKPFCSHSNRVIVNRTLASCNNIQKNHLLNSDRFFCVHVKPKPNR